MALNLWSVLLIASASQCVFLIALFAIRPPANRKALLFLLLLILVLLAINVNNIWYASYLYRNGLGIAGFARGMILLLGPLFFLYTKAVIRQDFSLNWAQLLHLVPFLIAWVLIYQQDSPNNAEEAVIVLDRFMSGELPISTLSISRFILYPVHLAVYIYLSRREMLRSLLLESKDFLVSTELRVSWLQKANWTLILIGIQQVGFTIYMISDGHYTIVSNFVLTLLISGFAYLIAYQTIFNSNQLLPDFSARYKSVRIKDDTREDLLKGLDRLFDQEKIFRNPDLKIQEVANRLNTSAHILSNLINTSKGKSFFELLNHHRIEEFIAIAQNGEYANYSIMGMANEAGYKSKSSFNTAFKKHTGETPSEYLKNRP